MGSIFCEHINHLCLFISSAHFKTGLGGLFVKSFLYALDTNPSSDILFAKTSSCSVKYLWFLFYLFLCCAVSLLLAGFF